MCVIEQCELENVHGPETSPKSSGLESELHELMTQNINFKIGNKNSTPVYVHRNVVAAATCVSVYNHCSNLTVAPTHSQLQNAVRVVAACPTRGFQQVSLYDPDNHIARLGDRSPWGAMGSHLGHPTNPIPMYTPVLDTYTTDTKPPQTLISPYGRKQCRVTFVTGDVEGLYLCTLCYGPERNLYTPLNVDVDLQGGEDDSRALRRLGGTYFPAQKHVLRAIHKLSNSTPHTRVEKGRDGRATTVSHYGGWIVPSIALTMVPADSNLSDTIAYNLANTAKVEWVEVRTLIRALLKDPYNSACAKSILILLKQDDMASHLPAAYIDKIGDARLRLRPRNPVFIEEWLRQTKQRPVPTLVNKLANRTSPNSNPYALPPLLPQIAAAVMRLPQSACEARRLQLVINLARERAFGHGSQQICARDVIEAAQNLNYEEKHDGRKRPVPCDFPPHHYPELQQALSRLADVVAQEKRQGINPPWVLVACERSAVIARHFRYAGCDVCTCDVLASDDINIPHFKGDARRITHLDFDLIIACPPCTFLCNASVMWLSREPERWTSMRQAAMLFKELYNSPAAFVVIENPVMHKHARQLLDNLNPTQIVHPFQHGHGETKATGLFIRGALPPLRPTCVMVGREKRLRSLSQGPDRGAARGRFFMGIGAAMAAQWTSTLIQHCKQKTIQRIRPNLTEIILELNAQESRRTQVVSPETYTAALISRSGRAPTYVAVMRPPPVGAPTNWVLCDHGAVLASGDEQALELLTERHPLPRCTQVECVEEAKRWWLQHLKAADYDETCKRTDDAMKSPRPYPVKRIRYKGKNWYAWMPTAKQGSTAGEYVWNRLAQPVQHCISEEIDRLSQVRISADGFLRTSRTAPLRKPLPTICDVDNESMGFDARKYHQFNNKAGCDQWAELRNDRDNATLSCQMCKVARSASGSRQCNCPETVGLGIGTPSHQPKSPNRNSGTPKVMKDTPKWIPFVKAATTSGHHESKTYAAALLTPTPDTTTECTAKDMSDEEPTTPHNTSSSKSRAGALDTRDELAQAPGPLLDLSTIPTLARQVSRKIDDAARYGIAPTPEHHGQEAHCAYVSDLVIIDPKRGENLHVTSFVRYCIGDTGAGISVLAAGLAKLLPPSELGCISPAPSHIQNGVVAADGKPLVILGTVQLTFYLGGRLFRHKFQVVEGGDLLILGNDFIAAHKGSVHPRLIGDEEEGYMEINHEPSGVRVRSSLLPTPCNWVPVRRCTGHNSPGKEMVTPQVGGGARKSLEKENTYDEEMAIPQVGGNVRVPPEKENFPANNSFGRGPKQVAGAVAWVPGKANRNSYSDMTMQPGEQDAPELPFDSHLTEDLVELTMPKMPDPLEKELYNKYLVTRDHLLVVHKPIAIPAQTEKVLQVRLPKQLIGHKGPLLIKTLPLREGLGQSPVLVAASICHADGPFIPIKVLNVRRETVFLAEMTALATIETDILVPAKQELVDRTHTWESLTEEQQTIINGCVIDEGGVLSPDQVKRVRNLLAAHITVFAPNPKAPGTTHFLEVELELRPGAKPHKHAPSRLGPEGHKIAQEAVAEMEKNGIIRKSSSPWASRMLIVKKKSGEARICIDLRDVNSKLLIQDTPLPRCDDSISRLAAAPDSDGNPSPGTHKRFFHTLDLASGFHALPIKEEHKERLAFVTERGKYEFNYLPFGVNCGPSYMQRLIESAMEGLSWDHIACYIDDIVAWQSGRTIDEAFDKSMERLDLVLERLRWAGLTAKATKCHLFSQTVEYLGHIIGQTGISPDPKKIIGVSRICARDINTLEKVRSFLGLTGYYRQFVKDYHLLSGPLCALTKKGVDVRIESQTPLVQEAIESLKTALTTAPVLAPPKSDRPFILHTDAATGHGLGAILIQRDDSEAGETAAGPERPVAFYGRRCTDAEKKYTVTENELLAVVESIKHFRPYLWGRKFTVITDHSALRWLHTMKDSIAGGASSRLTRWALRLQEYRFDVQHKPGKLHQDADAISRLVGCITPQLHGPEEEVKTVTSGSFKRAVGTAMHHLCLALADENNIRDLANRIDANNTTSEDCPRPLLTYALDLRQNAAEVALHGALHLPSRTVLTMPVPVLIAAMITHDTLRKTQLNESVPRVETLRDEQLQDEDCTEMLTYLIARCTPSDPKRAGWISRNAAGCTIENGVLQHTATINGTKVSRVWIPRTCREAFLTAYHDRLGHQSRDRTYQLMQRAVYWPGMSADVAGHLAECHECTFSKKGSRQHGATQPPEVGLYPFELLVADILSMRETEDGYTKVLIFADSMTRWVEAIPLKKDPTSAEVLDIFMNIIVCRHGVPRSIRSDCGSNLTSKLCQEIYRLCGVNLAQSTAYHHQSAGIVERWNHTLTEMTKASDKEGRSWAKHLPFLCFAYNATPHRITRESPACLLYGRELRLPANMDLDPVKETTAADSLSEYAKKLYRRLRLAWDATLQHTYLAQAGDAERIDARRHVNTTFEIDDRVLMKVSTSHLNKLEYQWTGPYRVSELLGKGVYRLRDLHNKQIVDRVSVDRLRAYLTLTDVEPLAPDEYIVRDILKHRVVDNKRQYLVKWRGFQKPTWTDEKNLQVRCDDLLERYHQNRGAAKRIPRPEDPSITDAESGEDEDPEPPPVVLTSLRAESDTQRKKEAHRATPADDPVIIKSKDGSEYPGGSQEAKYERGTWMYKVYFPTSRGLKPRWLPPHNFTEIELRRLEPLRDDFTASTSKLQQKICALYAPAGVMKTEPVSIQPCAGEMRPGSKAAAKIIFLRTTKGRAFLWVGARVDSDERDPQWDLPGGKFDQDLDPSLAMTAIRELREEVHMPETLMTRCETKVMDPPSVTTECIKRGQRHEISIWTVEVNQVEAPELRARAQQPPEWHVAKWVDLSVVLKSLRRPASLRPYANAIEAAVQIQLSKSAAVTPTLSIRGGGPPCLATQVGGNKKLSTLFDIADIVANHPELSTSDSLSAAVDAFLVHLRATTKTMETRSAILAVLYAHVHYDIYTNERICELLAVPQLRYATWRYRLHAIANSDVCKKNNTTRVAFINCSGPATLLWAGVRSDVGTWDLPGGQKIITDTSARDNAWREATGDNIKLKPSIRAQLSRTLTTNPAIVIEEVESYEARNYTHKIAMWAQMVKTSDMSSFAMLKPEDQSKWKTYQWIPLSTLLTSIMTTHMREYALGCRVAVLIPYLDTLYVPACDKATILLLHTVSPDNLGNRADETTLAGGPYVWAGLDNEIAIGWQLPEVQLEASKEPVRMTELWRCFVDRILHLTASVQHRLATVLTKPPTTLLDYTDGPNKPKRTSVWALHLPAKEYDNVEIWPQQLATWRCAGWVSLDELNETHGESCDRAWYLTSCCEIARACAFADRGEE